MTTDEFFAEMSKYPVSADIQRIEGLVSWMTAVEGLLASLLKAAADDGDDIQQYLSIGDAGIRADARRMAAETLDEAHFNNLFRRLDVLLRYRYGIDVFQGHGAPPDAN